MFLINICLVTNATSIYDASIFATVHPSTYVSRHLDLHPNGPSQAYKLRMGWDKARETQTHSLKGDGIQPDMSRLSILKN